MSGRVLIPILAFAILLPLACSRDVPPEQRVQHRRLAHEIMPTGTTTIYTAAGEPLLVVDMRVSNTGVDPLRSLTVLVRVTDPAGTERLARRVSLNLADMRPGVGIQTAVKIPGFALAEDDELTVELESQLTPEEIRDLPEFQEVTGGAAGGARS